ncbi:MAG: DUF2793 domain-containing protein [Rhizobiaceae bacterium]|nr:DUF2793 domain-containing protein [Rhizobiaceae bacterium]
MERTPLLDLPLIMPSQAQQHVTHNEALMALDGICQLSVIDRHLAAPPGDPANGDRYIVAASASDAWDGWDGGVALCVDGAWVRLEPRTGWLAWVEDEQLLLGWDGSNWIEPTGSGSGGSFSMLGVNASADETNRIAVAAEAALFSHDNVTPGSGDMRIKANKAAAGNTASFLFQTDWSGRAEFGLAGDDDFHVKVSADGSTWNEALVIDKDTGAVSMPNSAFGLKILTAHGTTGTSMASGAYVDQAWDSTTRNDFGGGAWSGTEFTTPEDGVYDLSAVLSCDTSVLSPTQADMYFLKNGSAQLGFMKITNGSAQNTVASRVVLALATGDTICARMRQNSGNTQVGLSAAAFSIVKLA